MSRRSKVLALLAIPACACAAAAASLEVSVRDASGQPIADAVVHATPASGPAEARGARHAAVEQVDREFIPYVSVVQTGTSVTFPNRDPILHHVYSFSQAKPFEIKLYTGKSPTEVVFDRPGIVTLGCNIHDWMIAYIAVVSTPHFAKTDATGVARLRDLPAGAYEVRTWHPQQRAGAEAQAVALEASTAAQASFGLEVAPRKPKYKPPLERLRY
ncbi:MAG TPA: methylamine utilization protein [Usitatibacter sp.]|nr:methylamine utilization protein [Usitatibacter sp.]